MSQGHWMARAAAIGLRKAQAMGVDIYKEVASTAAENCNCGDSDAPNDQLAEPSSAAICGRI